MDFGFSEEQELLRAEVRKFLDQNASLERVREIMTTDTALDRALWERMAELGWVGLAIPEEYGGTGLDFVTLIVLLEEAGRSLFPSPLISTVIAARAIELAGSAEQKSRWLPGLADGSTIGGFAYLEEEDLHDLAGIRALGKRDGDTIVLSGGKQLVSDTVTADVFVVAYRTGSARDAVSLALVEADASGLEVDHFPSIDPTKRIGRLRFDGVRIGTAFQLGPDGSAGAAIEHLLDLGALLVTAEAVGTAEGVVSITAEFAKQRVQFGSPIGRYQGVKHPLAEAHVDVESFKSLVYYAAWALDEAAADASQAVSRAKAYASETLPRIGIEGVQLHGGVGFTADYDIQLYLKRSKWLRPAFGDADHHFDKLAAVSL